MSDATWWVSQEQLDDDQAAIIGLPTDVGNHLILGPPGSGKTNILLLRASYLRSAGLGNCSVIVFTGNLRDFLASGAMRSTRFPSDRITTHAAWTLELLAQLGAPFQPSSDDLNHDDARMERHNALEAAVARSRLGSTYFDSILLDEVQDYLACEIELLSRLTQRLFAVGDSRQRIYGQNEGVQAAIDAGCETKELQYHYRLGPAICRVADRILPTRETESLLTYSQYDDREFPSSVSVLSGIPLPGQLDALKEKLLLQLDAYPGEPLGVIAVKRATRDAIGHYLRNSDLSPQVAIQSHRNEGSGLTFEPQHRVVVSTLHSAKGTEFRCVHFLAADEFPYFTREKAFTAVTRAKTTLDVYHDGPLHASLEAALAIRTVPSLEGSFR